MRHVNQYIMLHILYIIAITAEAMTAALSAGRRNMDWVGVFIIAWVTALGGGTIRNILLGHYPMTWVSHPEYLLITAGGAILAGLIASFMKRLRNLFLFLDALGLVVFTIIGCQLGEELHLPMIIIVMSGVITGCAGGVLRDVLCNDIPLLFRKEIYASASFVTKKAPCRVTARGLAVVASFDHGRVHMADQETR